MAGADYKPCDVCNAKTFYDADLRYKRDGLPEGVGAIAVLCVECAKTFKLLVVTDMERGMVHGKQTKEG